MRKNTQDTFKAWRNGKSFKAGGAAVWTDGKEIFSYSTPIVTVKGNVVTLNNTRYSVTTTCQQNGLAVLLTQSGIRYETTEDVNS